VKWFFRICSLSLLLTAIVAGYNLKDLSSVKTLLPDIQNEPVQSSTEEKIFSFDYKGATYLVEPVAEYELWGLVVSHNDIHAFSDIYHDETSVDIKDICVIWGKNATNRAFTEVEFWSEPWTCYTRWKHGQAQGFSQRDLSNNHLLSDSAKVRETIYSMAVGDQIYLKGLLVNYTEPGGLYPRNSSTTREDTGNGACEVFFVEEAKILKTGPMFWRNLYSISRTGLVLCLLTWFSFFLYDAYQPMRRSRLPKDSE
jgi:hypothetical protein